jgi:hypothetical protein
VLDWIKKSFLGKSAAVDPYEQFVREFAAECQRQDIKPKSYDPNARAFVFVRDDASE